MAGPSPAMTKHASVTPSPTEHDRDLLAAAIDSHPPLPPAGAGDAIKVGRSLDLLIVHRNDDIALAKADRLRGRAIGDADDHDALSPDVEAQLLGKRRRKVGDLGAEERRPGANLDLFARRLRRGLQADGDGDFAPLPQQRDLGIAAERLGGKAIVEGVRI